MSDTTLAPKRQHKPRKRVEKGIYRRGDTFEVLISEEGHTTFKQARNLTEARALRGSILAKRHDGQRVLPPETKTLRAAIAAYLEQTRVGPSTKALYTHNLGRRELRPLMGRKLAAITTDDIAVLIRELERPGGNLTTGGTLAASTIDNVLTALSAVFTLAVRRRWMQANPISGLTKQEKPGARQAARAHRILTADEIQRVVAAAGDRWRLPVSLAVGTGLRQSELLGLTWANVDLDAGRISVVAQLSRGGALGKPKTENAVREVPLPASLVKGLRQHKLASRWSDDEHPVFASDTGGWLDHRNLVRAWARIRSSDEAALPGPLPVWHDLRHTAASLLIAAGLDVVYVSRILGHSSPSITLDVYAGEFSRAAHEARATEALDLVFGGVL